MSNRMKTLGLLVTLFVATSTLLVAGQGKLVYRMTPGQSWVCTMSSKTEMEVMGRQNVNTSKNIIHYKVESSPNSGWVNLTASMETPKAAGGGLDMSGMTFSAELHESGQLRDQKHEGSAMPQMEGMEDLPAQAKAMMEQSANMVADMLMHSVFWFPELPEDALEPGDEFEVQRKVGSGPGGAALQMQAISKQVYVLDEIKDGLAYFTVQDRTITKTSGMSGEIDTKSAGKGEGVFDLELGMWVDLTIKSKTTADMSGLPGMGGAGNQEMLQIYKFEMELE